MINVLCFKRMSGKELIPNIVCGMRTGAAWITLDDEAVFVKVPELADIDLAFYCLSRKAQSKSICALDGIVDCVNPEGNHFFTVNADPVR